MVRPLREENTQKVIAAHDRWMRRAMAYRAVLREREAELLELVGPCSTAECRLHHAHRGPCNIKDKS